MPSCPLQASGTARGPWKASHGGALFGTIIFPPPYLAANATAGKPKVLCPDASPVPSAHVDERWVAARCTRNPGFGKDPRGLIMGFRPDRFPASLPASSQRKGTRAAVFSGGWAGLKPQDPPRQGWESVRHTPFLLCPLHGSSWHRLMLSPAPSVLPAEST